MDALWNATIHTPEVRRTNAAVLIEGGRILGVTDLEDVPRSARRLDLGGGHLAAGFVDAQVNGGGGILFNDAPDVDSLRRIGLAHRRFGTTGFLPTLITDSPEKRRAAVGAVRAALAEGVPGILGLHLEGPHINPERRGVHDAHWIRPLHADDLALMTSLEGGVVLVTLAPESVPAEMIGELTRRGVRVAAGHTAASYDETRAGLAAGITGFTHLFNAMSPLTSREPGAVGAALEDAASWCGIIADGHHVHPATLRLAWRVKAPGRLFLVTDAMPPTGADSTAFSLYGEAITVKDGRCVNAEGKLAGSALDMASAVRYCVREVGIPLDEALRMASAYPAEFLGIAGQRGRIARGRMADLVLLDDDLQVRGVWTGGKSLPEGLGLC
ncbi:MAG TPA: N-acetylglucosamine-6-phosphate deacetylase [Azospirillaceae bacterium]|nr:N-acetylglucosamine-6-phosphate deacetylase [Azospirillaceae bacterium]